MCSFEPEHAPEGEIWGTYFASRLAWSDEAVSFRRGVQWQARETGRERIESPEWVEISNGVGNIVCFGLGLPFHRRPSTTWLDTLLCVAGESRRRFQFAVGLDCTYPTQTALALLTAGHSQNAALPYPLPQSHGWFLHVGAKNLLVTHLELLAGERAGIRCRILETEGREVETTLAAFRPFHAARTTDFRANDNRRIINRRRPGAIRHRPTPLDPNRSRMVKWSRVRVESRVARTFDQQPLAA